jgi:inosose dehydratase
MVTRREFLAASLLAARLKPSAPTDLMEGEALRLARPELVEGRARSGHALAEPPIKYGYAAITWGANITQAIEDISAVGFRAIQLRGDAVTQFGTKPQELRGLLAKHGLTFAVLSSGNLSIDPRREREMLVTHTRHAQFVRDAGGLYLQVIDERPKARRVVAADYRRVGRLLTELGKRTADLGIPLVYHHHMNSTGEKPNEIAAVLRAADPKHVRLLFDIAHFKQGGGDPVAALRLYRDWIEVLHLKDVRVSGGPSRYEFVELGRGHVDVNGVFDVLRDLKYDKWAIVELDRVVDPGRTPKEAAEANKRYLVEQLHQVI